jgi:acetoin utilization protein AcuB
MKISYKGFMRDMIQRNPVTISPDASFSEARSIIHKRGVRHLPVVDNDHKVVGIVTEADIRKTTPSDAKALSTYEFGYLLDHLKVSDLMTPKDKLITITPDTH